VKAYEHWVEYGDAGELDRQIEAGRRHWLQVSKALVGLHESRVKSAWQEMESLIERQSL
jgi:hypothetical protein